MIKSDIKMICSDLDGTLLTYNQTVFSDHFFDIVRELYKRGIIFVPSSGRQIVSLRKLFGPVTDCCYYICSNGAVICDSNGEIIEKIVMPREDALAIAYDFIENTDGRGEVNVAGPTMCHLWSRDLGMVDRLKFIGNKYEIINDPSEVSEDIVKVSVFIPDGADKYVDRFLNKWQKYNPAIAGPYWIDTTLANKGSGVKALCNKLGIDLSQVMAFGDNYNDVSMLDIVGHPYLMSSATDELLDRYSNHTDSVEKTLEQFLNSIK